MQPVNQSIESKSKIDKLKKINVNKTLPPVGPIKDLLLFFIFTIRTYYNLKVDWLRQKKGRICELGERILRGEYSPPKSGMFEKKKTGRPGVLGPWDRNNRQKLLATAIILSQGRPTPSVVTSLDSSIMSARGVSRSDQIMR